MTPRKQILFIQGGGAGVHDHWDNKLMNSLALHLGDGFEVRYPRMPREDDPSYAGWRPAIRRELANLDDQAILIGHSVGGTILIQTLTELPPAPPLAEIILISAPFVGLGGWAADEFALPNDLGSKLPRNTPVHLFHGLDDDIVPPAHVERYAAVIPHAQVHRLAARDHQLNDDLNEVAVLIAAGTGRADRI